MRVLHIITGLTVGGAEDQLIHIARHSRHATEVACLDGFGPAGERLVQEGVRVFNTQTRGRYDPRAVIRLARIIRRRRYEVVHVHLFRAGLHGRLAARLSRVPLILYTEHSIGADEIEGLPATRALRSLYRASARLSDLTIAVSPWVDDQLRAWGVPGATKVIENGVDLESFAFDPRARESIRAELGIPADARVIGTVGRMVARKQQALLVAGAAPLVREGAWLTLVGDGPLRTALEDQVADLGIGDRTRFTGMRQDVPAVLSAVDVFASLATEEMYGLAPVEGLASGLPVVVVHCPPLLGSGPPRVRWAQPTATSVTDALRAALAQPPGRTGMDELLRERHDVRVTVATLDALYERLLGGSSQGHG